MVQGAVMIVREERIGDCRLILGDAMKIVPALGLIDSLVCDPPYGMSFQSNYRITKHKPIENDGDVKLLHWACSIKVRYSSYVWMRWDNIPQIPMPRSLITWVKNNHSMGDLDHEHGRQTEVCAFYKGAEHRWPSLRPTDVINCARTGNEYHPTEKPVALMQAVIGWTLGKVVDCFMGSGSTGVACAKSGRSFVGIELDPTHFETACRRVEAAYAQPDLFIAPPTPKPTQDTLL